MEISYNGRKAVAPVWDVGPWNTKDNYWDAEREIFKDLHRFTPQVNAAFFDNYNDGKDQYGRLVLYPAAIELARRNLLGRRRDEGIRLGRCDLPLGGCSSLPGADAKSDPKGRPETSAHFRAKHGAHTTTGANPTPTPTPIPKTWYFAEGQPMSLSTPGCFSRIRTPSRLTPR